MSNGTGRIVQALAGRDRGNFLFVVGQTQDGQLLLADGKPKSCGMCVSCPRSLTTPSFRSCNKEPRSLTGN